MSAQPKMDRHSNMAVDGRPKKGGAGKGGWGVGGAADLQELTQSPRDPNYESDSDDIIDGVENADPILKKIQSIIEDYLASGSLNEAIPAVQEAKFHNHSNFIRKAMLVSMERQPFERELVSQLIAALRMDIVPEDQYDEAFQIFLNKLPQITIDIPQAVDMLSKFLARAVLDEVVSPSFVRTCNLAHLQAEECVTLVQSLVHQKHRIHRIQHIWGPADLNSIKRLKEEMKTIVEEFISNGDVNEAQRNLTLLKVPHFSFHFVKQSVRMALEVTPQQQKQISSLLSELYQADVIGSGQIRKGFECVEENLNDIKLDVPTAETTYAELKKNAIAGGWLIQEQPSSDIAQ